MYLSINTEDKIFAWKISGIDHVDNLNASKAYPMHVGWNSSRVSFLFHIKLLFNDKKY